MSLQAALRILQLAHFCSDAQLATSNGINSAPDLNLCSQTGRIDRGASAGVLRDSVLHGPASWGIRCNGRPG